jgi:ubiquinone/menaquinone biosynthesis C-methylase UbiE
VVGPGGSSTIFASNATNVAVVSDATEFILSGGTAEGMLGVARNNSEVEWHQGSATAMPFADGGSDLVLCQQGLHLARSTG